MTFVTYTGTGGAIRGVNCSLSMRTFGLITSGSWFDLANVAQDKSLSVFQCALVGATTTSIINGFSTCLFEIVNYANNTAGVSFSGMRNLFILQNNCRTSNTGTFFTITPAPSMAIQILNNVIDVPAGSTGISVIAPTTTQGAVVKGNTFTGAGTRLTGVDGNAANWVINFGGNVGIAGLQFIDIDVANTADATLTGVGTFTEATTVRGYVLRIQDYDPLATNMEGIVTALMTIPTLQTVQIGLRNLTTATNLLTSLGPAVDGTLIANQSVFIPITPNNNYNAFYVKTGVGSSTRFALKLTVKVY